MEHDISDYPRITVGNELIRYLRFVRDQSATTIHTRSAKRTAELCLRLLSPDSDGNVILDYLGGVIREIGAGAVRPEILERVYQFAASELVHFRCAGDSWLTSRYERLNAYLASRRDLWAF